MVIREFPSVKFKITNAFNIFVCVEKIVGEALRLIIAHHSSLIRNPRPVVPLVCLDFFHQRQFAYHYLETSQTNSSSTVVPCMYQAQVTSF